MKKATVLLLLLFMGASTKLLAQTQEAEQLLLNVAKLAQLKQILSDMKGNNIPITAPKAVPLPFVIKF